MIEGLQPYTEYKETGQSWLGRIPNHWGLLPNRALFEEVKDRNHPSAEMLSVTITRGIIRQKALLSDTSKKDSSNVNKAAYKLVQPGDIAYNKMRAWQGAVGASSFRGIISPAYVVMRPRQGCAPWYYHHLYRTPSFAKEAERWSYGITSDMWSLRPEHFKVIYSVQPPPDEQAAIVRFLDHANQKIDGFIRAKRKLIGLLNEQKQAIIHRAVTRGLNPNAPLKPSGIPWLGDIPQHWEVCFLRMRYSVELGKMLDAKRITGKHLVPYLRNRDVQWGRILVEELPRMDILPSEHNRYTVKKGDLLVCEGGQVGRCAFWNDELPICGFQKALHRVRAQFRERDCPRFLFYQLFLCAALGIFAADGNENTIAHLTCEKLRRHRFAFPMRDEQEQIASHLDDELKSLNTAIARTEREIALMQEYRTRLTADVVTGKLDVRAAAAKLPDLSQEESTSEPSEVEAEEFEEAEA